MRNPLIQFVGKQTQISCAQEPEHAPDFSPRVLNIFKNGIINFRTLAESYQGWQAYAKWAGTHKLREKIKREIIDAIWSKIKFE